MGTIFWNCNVIKGQWRKGDIFEWKHKMLHWSSNASMKQSVLKDWPKFKGRLMKKENRYKKPME